MLDVYFTVVNFDLNFFKKTINFNINLKLKKISTNINFNLKFAKKIKTEYEISKKNKKFFIITKKIYTTTSIHAC